VYQNNKSHLSNLQLKHKTISRRGISSEHDYSGIRSIRTTVTGESKSGQSSNSKLVQRNLDILNRTTKKNNYKGNLGLYSEVKSLITQFEFSSIKSRWE
jgi:hypothetical protein